MGGAGFLSSGAARLACNTQQRLLAPCNDFYFYLKLDQLLRNYHTKTLPWHSPPLALSKTRSAWAKYPVAGEAQRLMQVLRCLRQTFFLFTRNLP